MLLCFTQCVDCNMWVNFIVLIMPVERFMIMPGDQNPNLSSSASATAGGTASTATSTR